jgi:hypothetical protein
MLSLRDSIRLLIEAGDVLPPARPFVLTPKGRPAPEPDIFPRLTVRHSHWRRYCFICGGLARCEHREEGLGSVYAATHQT